MRVALSRTRATSELEAGRQPGRALEDRIILEARAAPAELPVIDDGEPSLPPPASTPIGAQAPGSAAGPAIGEHDGTAGDDETPAGIVTPRDKWRVVVGAAGVKPGDVFDDGTRKLTQVLHFGLFSVGVRVCIAVREGADGTSRGAVSLAKRIYEQMKVFLDIKDEEPAPAVAPPPLEDDVRIRPIEFYSAEERFRGYDSAVNMSTEDDFDDWPIDGPRSVYAVLKQLRRDGRNFLQQHDDWVLRSQIDSANCAVHEHRVLSRALHFGVSYD